MLLRLFRTRCTWCSSWLLTIHSYLVYGWRLSCSLSLRMSVNTKHNAESYIVIASRNSCYASLGRRCCCFALFERNAKKIMTYLCIFQAHFYFNVLIKFLRISLCVLWNKPEHITVVSRAMEYTSYGAVANVQKAKHEEKLRVFLSLFFSAFSWNAAQIRHESLVSCRRKTFAMRGTVNFFIIIGLLCSPSLVCYVCSVHHTVDIFLKFHHMNDDMAAAAANSPTLSLCGCAAALSILTDFSLINSFFHKFLI